MRELISRCSKANVGLADESMARELLQRFLGNMQAKWCTGTALAGWLDVD
jgi:hypothetical protein